MSNSLPAIFAICLIFLVITAAFSPVFYFTASYRQGLADTTQVPISELVAGTTVMVYGQISSPASPTLWAFWVSTGKSGYWSWSANDFTLVKGSSSVSIDVLDLGNSVYGAPFEGNSNQYYYPGDSIAIIGPVSGSNGSFVVHAQEASTSPAGFADPTSYYIWGASLGLVALLAAGVIYGYIRGVQRLHQHEARARQPGMFDYKPLP